MTAPLPQDAASALWVLHHVGARTEAEQWADTAVQRGATRAQADEHLAAWDEENAPVVIGDGGLDPAPRRHPAGSRTPARLTGSERYGGGDPLADYLWLKGEL